MEARIDPVYDMAITKVASSAKNLAQSSNIIYFVCGKWIHVISDFELDEVGGAASHNNRIEGENIKQSSKE